MLRVYENFVLLIRLWADLHDVHPIPFRRDTFPFQCSPWRIFFHFRSGWRYYRDCTVPWCFFLILPTLPPSGSLPPSVLIVTMFITWENSSSSNPSLFQERLFSFSSVIFFSIIIPSLVLELLFACSFSSHFLVDISHAFLCSFDAIAMSRLE